jgi:hypothetical protein
MTYANPLDQPIDGTERKLAALLGRYHGIVVQALKQSGSTICVPCPRRWAFGCSG